VALPPAPEELVPPLAPEELVPLASLGPPLGVLFCSRPVAGGVVLLDAGGRVVVL
jgi:hypothetical protein